MSRIRATLTGQHVLDACRQAEEGSTALLDFADMREPGLIIRVRGRKASWLLRFRSSTVTLGPAGRWTVRQAREMASHVRGMLKSGLDPRRWVDARLAGADSEEAAGVVLRREGRERQEWTARDLMDRYLSDHVRKGRVVRGVRRIPSAATARDVEAVIASAPFKEIAGQLVRELDPPALEGFRNQMGSLHGGSASRKALAYLKAALTWARRHHSAASGLAGAPGWWRDVASDHVETTKSRMPSIEDVGLTIAVAEAVRRLPGRRMERPASEATVLMLWLIALTAQRRDAVASIKRAHVVEDSRADAEGWGVLYFPPGAMKGRREHSIPLPPKAMAIIQRALVLGGEEDVWLLPAARRGRSSEVVHASGSSVNRMLARLRGRDESGRETKAPDLLKQAGVTVPDWSPHDVRRTFATMIEDMTTRGDAVSAVLDHDQPGARVEAQGAAAITRAAYSQSQRISLKRIAMEPWVDAVVAAVESARPRVNDLLQLSPSVPEPDGGVPGS